MAAGAACSSRHRACCNRRKRNTNLKRHLVKKQKIFHRAPTRNVAAWIRWIALRNTRLHARDAAAVVATAKQIIALLCAGARVAAHLNMSLRLHVSS
jgi:hypothetical protein